MIGKLVDNFHVLVSPISCITLLVASIWSYCISRLYES